MDFSSTEGQRDLGALTREILADHATSERLRAVERGPDRFDPELWHALGAADVLGAALPTAVDGSGFGILEQCAVLVELGRAVAPVPYLSSTAAATAIAQFGDAKQCDAWARTAAKGERVLTTALFGDDEVRADRDFRGWHLDGVRTLVPAAGIADLVLVPARTSNGEAVFLVSPDDPGVTAERQTIVDGDATGWIRLDGVLLDDERMLGSPGRCLLEPLADQLAIGTCAHQLGVCERALELTAEYARERVQFDKPIGSFQAVSQRLGDAYVDVQAIRLTLWQAAWRFSAGLDCREDLATARFWAAEAGHRVAHTAVHLHGGVGIDLDNDLHRYFTAAKRNEFTLGGATASLLDLGEHLASTPVGDPAAVEQGRTGPAHS